MSNKALFTEIQIKQIGGIDRAKPIILDLRRIYRARKNVVLFTGDQGVGKTSILSGIGMVLCAKMGLIKDDLVNKESNRISVDGDFKYKGVDYNIHVTATRFQLFQKAIVDGNEDWVNVPEPMTTLKDIIGPVGTSPMNLKGKRGQDQIKELRHNLKIPERVLTYEEKLLAKLDMLKEKRADAFRMFTGLQKNLSQNSMYLNWDECEKKYANEETIESVQEEFNTKTVKLNTLNAAKNKLEFIQSNIYIAEAEIKQLEDALKAKKEHLQGLHEALSKGMLYVEDNKSAPDEYMTAQRNLLNIQTYLSEKRQWEEVQQKKSEMDQAEDLVQQFDAKKDETREKLLEVAKHGLPYIEGLEIVTVDSIDGKTPVGIYLHGKNINQLSESELWGLFLKIWEANNTEFIIIENITDLGSDTSKILNDLAAKDVKIFGSLVVKGQNKLKIQILEQVPIVKLEGEYEELPE